jgi:uncharacterized membrane protein AbrB (regulator of aidB expression)
MDWIIIIYLISWVFHENQVDDEHFSLVVDFLHFAPLEVVGLAAALQCDNPAVINTQIQRVTTVVLRRNK